MCIRHCVRLAAAISLFCLISPLCLLSQTEVASLFGTVRHPQGASIPGVEVRATRSCAPLTPRIETRDFPNGPCRTTAILTQYQRWD